MSLSWASKKRIVSKHSEWLDGCIPVFQQGTNISRLFVCHSRDYRTVT